MTKLLSAGYGGISLSPGIAIGPAFHLKQIDLEATKRFSFEVENIDNEQKRLESAVVKSQEQLTSLHNAMKLSGKDEAAQIFSAQHLLLSDVFFLEQVKTQITLTRLNAEHVLAHEIETVKSRFNTMENELFRIKALDIQDVYYRLLRNLLEIEHVRTGSLHQIDGKIILVAEKLLPSDIVILDKKHLLGIVLEEGSTVSHVAIIAKSLGIPVIINVRGISTMVRSSARLIVDGFAGKVIVDPSDDQLSFYIKEQGKKKQPHGPQCVRHDHMTADGRRINLEINVGCMEDIIEGMRLGAEGIGLLRSELFYLSLPVQPSVEEETAYYREAIVKSDGAPVTIRLLDIGADKSPSYLTMPQEDSPQLGTKGIRYLLENRSLMQQHIKAIVQAAHFGPIKILIPFVSLVSELTETRAIVADICTTENIDPKTVPLGMMVEIPSAVFSISSFVGHADFFSIGTNDLSQYMFAASRENGRLEQYRQHSDDLMITMVRLVCSQTALVNKPVSVCGEIATQPKTAKLLIGSGINTLSIQPKSIPAICKAISESSYQKLKERLDKNQCAADPALHHFC